LGKGYGILLITSFLAANLFNFLERL
jgi:hypothetical protein